MEYDKFLEESVARVAANLMALQIKIDDLQRKGYIDEDRRKEFYEDIIEMRRKYKELFIDLTGDKDMYILS